MWILLITRCTERIFTDQKLVELANETLPFAEIGFMYGYNNAVDGLLDRVLDSDSEDSR